MNKELLLKIVLIVALPLLGLLVRAGTLTDTAYLPFTLDTSKYEQILTDWDISDNDWNYLAARNIAAGQGLSTSLAPPYKPTMFRSPAYPVVLGTFFRTFGETNAPYMQLAFFLTSFVLFSAALWRVFGYAAAVIFLVLVSFADVQFLWRYAMANTYLPLLLLLFSLYLLLHTFVAQPGRKGIVPFLIGGLTAAIMLTRSEFLFLPLFSVAVLALVCRKAKARSILSVMLLFALGMALLYGPWIVRNYLKFETLSPGGRGGMILAHRGLAAEAVSEGMDYWEFHRTLYIDDFIHPTIRGWLAEGKNPDMLINMEQEAGREGVRLIRKNMASYLKGSWEEFACMQAFNPTSLSLLGPSNRSFFAKLQGIEPHYRFAFLCFLGVLVVLLKAPIKAFQFFHIPAYFLLLNAAVNSTGCMYVTTVLIFYYIGLALLLAGIYSAGMRLFGARSAHGAV